MDSDGESPAGWYGPVMADLAKALRRDGLYQTAELLDDAVLRATQEQNELAKRRAESSPTTLRLIK